MSSPAALRSYDALYRAHFRRLIALIGRRTGRSEAEDIVQESFLRLIEIQSAGKTVVEQPGPYLTRIAINLLRDRARQAARHPATQIIDDYPPITGPDPEREIEARDILNRVSATLSRLSPVTRRIYTARRVYGYSYQEISASTGLTFKGIEHHMTKAIARVEKFTVRSAKAGEAISERPVV